MRNFKVALAIGVTAAAAVGTAVAFRPHAAAPQAAAPVKPVAAAVAKPAMRVTLDLPAALLQNRVRAEFKGNGKDRIAFTLHNNGAEPLRLHIAGGQFFTSAKSSVALLRSCDVDIEPNSRKSDEWHTVATSSANLIGDDAFNISAAKLPHLDTLFAYLDEHPEVPIGAAQAATLALTENVPLSAFARFSMPDGGATSKVDTTAFKTDTCDIVAALMVLRDAKLDAQLALAVDPQLKIEAMIDPLAHAMALHYYDIHDEWAYWKNELLQGNLATRHYALFGIGRFYPEIAVQMLPKWIRSQQTSAVFRKSAIQALAETQQPEALGILRQLQNEFGAGSEYGKISQTAADYLDAQFSKPATAKTGVPFRASRNFAQQKPVIAAMN